MVCNAVVYNALGRPDRTTDQQGDTIMYLYNLDGPWVIREFRIQANSPSGQVTHRDSGPYNTSGQVLAGYRGYWGGVGDIMVKFSYPQCRK